MIRYLQLRINGACSPCDIPQHVTFHQSLHSQTRHILYTPSLIYAMAKSRLSQFMLDAPSPPSNRGNKRMRDRNVRPDLGTLFVFHYNGPVRHRIQLFIVIRPLLSRQSHQLTFNSTSSRAKTTRCSFTLISPRGCSVGPLAYTELFSHFLDESSSLSPTTPQPSTHNSMAFEQRNNVAAGRSTAGLQSTSSSRLDGMESDTGDDESQCAGSSR